MDKFNILYHSNSYPKRNIDKIFLPYLLEKLALGIISNDEKAELNAIFGKTGKAEDIKDATSVESFATDYDRALIMLAALNLLDYDNSGIIQGYDNSRNITYNNGNKRVRGLGFLDDYSILSEAKRLVESLALQSDLKGFSKNQSNDIEPGL